MAKVISQAHTHSYRLFLKFERFPHTTSQTRVGHSVLFRLVHYILFRSKKRTFRSFPFFSRVFGDL